MKSLLVAASAALAFSVMGASEASAQHYRCGSGSVYGFYSTPRVSVSIGYGGYGGFSGYRSSSFYGGHSHRVWHDTSHLDYHGPSLIRHRGHYDYVPGHYHLHQTGHWDRVGHHGHW